MIENTVSSVVYTADGTQTVWSIPFPYGHVEDVKLFVKVGTSDIAPVASNLFSIDTELGTITYPLSGDPLAANDKVIIMRITSQTQEETSALSSFKSQDIERMADKLTMEVQELQEQLSRCIAYNPVDAAEGELDAQKYIDDLTDLKTQATTAASTATAQANIATSQASTATTKASQAATSAQNAATSATNAATSESNAEKWAEGTDAQVEALGGIHSAKNWASGSAASAASAGTSADNAAASASAASASATAAQNALAEVQSYRRIDRTYIAGTAIDDYTGSLTVFDLGLDFDLADYVVDVLVNGKGYQGVKAPVDFTVSGDVVTFVEAVPVGAVVQFRINASTTVIVAGSVDVDAKIAEHNTSPTAHSNIRTALTTHTDNANIHVTAAQKTTWTGKQDAISDLATIRSGAAAGATAVQPSQLASVATSGSYNDLSNKPTIPDVTTKADTDLSNVTNTGTSTAAGWAMPSSSYDNLTLGASGTNYTAPANGFFCATGSGTSNSMWIELVTKNGGLRNGIYGTVNWNYKVYLPVRKGAQVQINYNAINFDFFRFYYAVGSESEAN